MTIEEQNKANQIVVKQLTFDVPVKQKSNGSWFGSVKDIERPFEAQHTVSKTKRQADGKKFKSVTVICTWTVSPIYNTIKTVWNEI